MAGLTMSEITATRRATSRAEKPRAWDNRRPAEKRLDLAPKQAEVKQAERAARQQTKPTHVQLTAAEREAMIKTRAGAHGVRLMELCAR